MKIFNEALSVFNKFFPSVPSKKRSRSEVFPYERSSSLLSSEHAALGPNLGKIGMQSHALPGGFELEQQKSEERIKNAIPSKRTRTSLVDVRVCILNFFLNISFFWLAFSSSFSHNMFQSLIKYYVILFKFTSSDYFSCLIGY